MSGAEGVRGGDAGGISFGAAPKRCPRTPQEKTTGLRPEAERAPRGCRPSTFRKSAPALPVPTSARQRRDRREQRAAGDGGCYSTTAYLQPPSYSGMCFLWGSTPFLSHTGKEMGWICPAQGPPLRIPANRYGILPQHFLQIVHAKGLVFSAQDVYYISVRKFEQTRMTMGAEHG